LNTQDPIKNCPIIKDYGRPQAVPYNVFSLKIYCTASKNAYREFARGKSLLYTTRAVYDL
jgi:hypothetical protein